MATVLLGNQWGGGVGHAKRYLLIADALHQRGHSPLFVVPDLVAARPILGEVSYPVLQAPVWKGRILRRQSTRTFADIMATQAFADEQVFSVLARAWETLLDTLKPDLVVADYAPLLCLAARDRLPLVAVGVPFCIPPGTMKTFPVLNPEAREAYPEQHMLALANRWLEDRGRSPLEALPAIHPAHHSYAFGLPDLDPYRDQQRAHPVRPLPQMSGSPLAPPAPGADPAVFAYLSARHRPSMRLLALLVRSGVRVETFLRDHNQIVADKLASVGVTVHRDHVPIREALGRVQLYIHHGSGRATMDALLHGRPQLCVPVDLEKQLITRDLESMGVARGIRTKEPGDDVVDGVKADCTDREFQERAQSRARDLLGREYEDPLPRMLADFEALLAG
jgi:rhamnosyltransferase subunit B